MRIQYRTWPQQINSEWPARPSFAVADALQCYDVACALRMLLWIVAAQNAIIKGVIIMHDDALSRIDGRMIGQSRTGRVVIIIKASAIDDSRHC